MISLMENLSAHALLERRIKMTVHELLDAALAVKPIAASLSPEQKKKGLQSMAESLISQT